MDGKRGLQRLFRWARTRPEPGAIDAADVGTAFGMELSIDEASSNDAASKPDRPQAPVQPPQPKPDRPKRR